MKIDTVLKTFVSRFGDVVITRVLDGVIIKFMSKRPISIFVDT